MRKRWLHKQLANGAHLLKKQRDKGFEETELKADLLLLDQLLNENNYQEATPPAERVAKRVKESIMSRTSWPWSRKYSAMEVAT